MASLTTGLIENTAVLGVRQNSTLSVRITNEDTVSAFIQIMGFYMVGTTKTEYVLESITLAPGVVENKHYFAQFDAFEFQFNTSSDAVKISAWGKDTTEDLTVTHRVLPAEFMVPSLANRIYLTNFSSNNVSVIDRNTNTVLATVTVGSGPFNAGVNPATNQIYVSNQGSNNVSVIDGFTNDVIATILVGASPERVDVDTTTNRIYVTNKGSNNVSVINGSTNTVIATLEVTN